ncbi:MAG TPA: hypothetical protein VJT73_18390 [Polyangiaceae bacterium]|nr:hypothetical protein [Polyangiaceae bacterium]
MTHRRMSLLVAMLAWVLSARVSAAEPKATEEELVPRKAKTTKAFYGWQILATGGAGGLISAMSLLVPERRLATPLGTAGFVVGMPAYALGGPIAHWTHDNFDKGLISFAGNIVVPLAGGVAARAIKCGHANAEDDCGTQGFFTGFAVGVVIAPILDALILGWEDVPAADVFSRVLPGPKRGANPGPFTIAPTANLGPYGLVQFGVSGKF